MASKGPVNVEGGGSVYLATMLLRPVWWLPTEAGLDTFEVSTEGF